MRVLAASIVVLAFAAGPVRAQGVQASFPSALTNTVLDDWLRANTTLKPKDVIAVGGGRVVGLVSRKRQPDAPSMVKLTVRTELVDKAAAEEAKALSESSVLDIDCDGGRAKLTEALQYAGRNMIGVMQVKPGWSDWITAAPGTTLHRMVLVACEVEAEAPAPATAKGRAKAKPAERPTPPPALKPPPTPKPPPRTAPPIAPAPPSPEPSPAAATEPAAKPASAAPVAVVRAHNGFGSWMQIGAWTDRRQAEEALVKAKAERPALVGGRPTTIEATKVGGQTYYRALVGGFGGAAEAGRQCSLFKAAGGACLVRTR